jgi:uncharacterized protein YukE
MAFYKSNGFKYFKNLVIGVGASVVMIGALGKINSEPWGGPAITAGLVTEAILFAFLGILPPEKDYYWDKLYPGLGKYNSKIAPLTAGEVGAIKPLDGEIVEKNLGGMLSELQTMSKSLSSLKALQEVDFSKTKEQMTAMNNFYDRVNEAMSNISDAVSDTERYKEQVKSLNSNIDNLNTNLNALNGVYGNVLSAFGRGQG